MCVFLYAELARTMICNRKSAVWNMKNVTLLNIKVYYFVVYTRDRVGLIGVYHGYIARIQERITHFVGWCVIMSLT